MFSTLMSTRRFAPLFWCQFFAALNDNFVKNALIIIILYQLGSASGPPLVTLAGVIFIAPFFILSALGGELADKYDKALMARRLKFAEIGVAAITSLGFILHSLPLLFVSLAALGIMAALFGPAKYGILPDQLKTSELAAGNAFVEGATFMAILLGTIAGVYAASDAGNPWIISVIVMALAVISWLAARQIPLTKAGAPDLKISINPFTSTMALLGELKAVPRLWSGGLIVSWFWLVGTVVLSLWPPLVKNLLGGTPGVVTLCLTVFTVGIAIGSALAARGSHARPNLSFVPIGAFAMGIFSLDLAWMLQGLSPPADPVSPMAFVGTVSGVRILFDLFALACAGGLFIVPSFAMVQSWADPDKRARVIASVNVLNAAFMTGAGALVAGLQAYGVPQWVFFAALGVSTIGVGFAVKRTWNSEIAAGDLASQ